MKPKFKVGDKVRILPSAFTDGVNKGDLGREAIVEENEPNDSMYIRMVPPNFTRKNWWVNGRNLKHVIRVGQQLMFSFMSDVDNT